MLLAVAGVLAACGSSARSSPPSTTRSQSADGARPLTKAQALAFADAVNLTAADVPGFKASSRSQRGHTSAIEKRLEREMLSCVGGSSGRASLAEAGSKSFERETPLSDESVSSEVAVAHSSAAAASGLGTIHSEHTKACLAHYFNLLFRGKGSGGATFGAVSVSQGTPPAPGASGSFGWRISTKVTGHGLSIPFYVDLLGFVYGPAEVSLLSSGAPRPFPAAAEQELYLLLLRRARAQAA